MAGCWTCRARKKKCGQQRPSCDECRRLGLRCDGYGQRPSWADGGIKEYDHKTQLKAFIKLRHRNKRTHSLPEPLLTPQLLLDSPDNVDDIVSLHTLPNVFNEPFQNLVLHLPEKQDDPQLSPIEFLLPSSNEFDQAITQIEMVAFQNADSCDSDSPCSSIEPTLHSSISEICSAGPSIDEYQLLSYYLDHIFWTQYPHLDPNTTTTNRTWVHILFQSSIEFREALIHLSTYLKTSSDQNSITDTKTNNAAGATIIERLATRTKALSYENHSYSREMVVALISAYALMAYYGMVTNNRSGIHNSLSVASTLLEHVEQLDRLSLTSPCNDLIASSAYDHLQPAIRYSITQLLWTDTFEAAMTGSPCTIQLYPITKKYDLDHELELLFGCRIWTIQVIREAIELAQWKRTCLVSGRLSVRELMSRSEILLDKIKRFQSSTAAGSVASIMPNTGLSLSLLPQDCRYPSTQLSESDDVAVLTKIHAQATAVYVHVIVSGATSSLLEIRSCISAGLELIAQLRSVDMLACMIWPLMMFTCLSASSQRDRCKGILDRAMHHPKLQKACVMIFDFAQQCWQLDSETPTMPWNWERVFHSGLGKS